MPLKNTTRRWILKLSASFDRLYEAVSASLQAVRPVPSTRADARVAMVFFMGSPSVRGPGGPRGQCGGRRRGRRGARPGFGGGTGLRGAVRVPVRDLRGQLCVPG